MPEALYVEESSGTGASPYLMGTWGGVRSTGNFES